MNSWGVLFGTVGMILSVGTAAVTGYRGWKRRVQDAAKKPFQAGQEAVNEAELALRLKDRRLEESSSREAKAIEELERANAANAAQQRQIASLYVLIGQLQSKNAELEETARRDAQSARGRDERAKNRISELELRLDEVMKQLGMGQ